MSTIEGKPVVTRIAPSPTGAFHLGTARTALYNYLFAKRNGGSFLVRFEDTDTARSDRRYERNILDSLAWLGIPPDTVIRQSDRTAVYRRHISRLIADNRAYRSKEPSKRNPSEEVEVIRYRNHDSKVSFRDTVRGTITIDLSDLDDFVIARDDASPLYNLAAAIDDIDTGVTHVLRGDDHIVNTPRQIALIRSLGFDPPSYTHVPLVHGEEGGKLSKRTGAPSVLDFKAKGYASAAVCNALLLLGWSPTDDRELFSPDDMVREFSLDRIQKREARFREKKLAWFHRQHVRTAPESAVRKEIVPALVRRFPLRSRINPRAVAAVVQFVRERGLPFQEARDHIQEGAHDFFFAAPSYETDLLIPDGEDRSAVRRGLAETQSILSDLRAFRGWDAESLHHVLREHAEQRRSSLVLWPLRVALSGRKKSPGPFAIMEVIGKKRTISRIRRAIGLLRDMPERV